METIGLPIFLFVVCAAALAGGMLVAGALLGPSRSTPVKRMPYECGVDPSHDARRRMDVRFFLLAVVFLIFDVEILFLYPWAVASKNDEGISRAVREGLVSSRGLVFAEVMFFLVLLTLGLVYVWRKGVFRWR